MANLRFGLVAALALTAASGTACGPAKAPVAVASLRIVGTPANASVVIDDVYVGALDFVAAHGVAVPAGTHRVTVEAPGHFPVDRLVEAQPGKPGRLEVALEKEPE